MGQIGTLGSVVFETSSKTVKTFRDYKRNCSARIGTHEIIGRKPVLEFLGPGIETVTFSVLLNSALGVKPEEEIEKLRKIRDEGQVVHLIMNNKPVTNNKWMLESIDEENTLGKGGAIVAIKASISLKEYVENV